MRSCKDIFVLLLFLYAASVPIISAEQATFIGDCYWGTGRNYRGTVSVSASGKKCQAWSSMTPHQHTRTPSSFPKADLRENYCRNPGDDANAPWCYTVDPRTRWEYCSLQKCQQPRARVFQSNCKRGSGYDYRGTMSTTRTGVICQRWADNSPHVPNYSPRTHPKAHLQENYCRNPDNDANGPWCYTTDPGTRYDYCNVPLCPDPWLQCRVGNGWNYRGTASATRTGVTCQHWAGKSPHVPNYSPETHPNEFLEENYCRNPDNDANGPWCYTTDPGTRYDYCSVPLCPDFRLECRKGNGWDYRGTASTTQRGLSCQRWAEKSPHVPRFSPKTHPNAFLEENYCRNPDNDAHGPWCYTTDPGIRYDYCTILECDDQNPLHSEILV